jgi:protein phosphatase
MESAPATLPAVEYGQRSDPGRDPDKQVNEDACGHRETRFGHLCVVCDGMGGHAGGREAAELALATIFEVLDQAGADASPAEALRGAVEEANRRVHVMRTSEIGFGHPGSTTVAVLMHAQGTEVAHVGDSRAYLVHGGQIARLTRDHSIVQELVDRGLLTALQAANHPDANRITRALGMSPEVAVELRAQPVHHVAGDAFLLCSDGLCDLVEDDEILAIVGGEPAAQAVGKLVDLANARGGHDNITAVVLRARETSQTSSAVAPTIVGTTVPDAPTAALAQRVETIPDAGGARRTVLDEAIVTNAPIAERRPLEPTPPLATAPGAVGARGAPIVVVAVVLASAAFALLAGVLITHFVERGGKRNGTAFPAADLLPVDAAPAPLTPASLTPGTVVVAPPSSAPSAEPIAPLEPTPGEVRRRKHRVGE